MEDIWHDGMKYICKGKTFPEWAVRGLEVGFVACKGVHSLMPNLGHVVEGDGLVGLCSGFHQRYERTR